MIVDDVGKALHAQSARLGLREVQDRDLPSYRAECLDHRLGRLTPARFVVSRDLANKLGSLFIARDIDREDRNARRVCLLHNGHDGLRLARTDDDRGHAIGDEVSHLIGLRGGIFLCIQDRRAVTVLLSLFGDVVSNCDKEWVLACQQRAADHAT